MISYFTLLENLGVETRLKHTEQIESKYAV